MQTMYQNKAGAYWEAIAVGIRTSYNYIGLKGGQQQGVKHSAVVSACSARSTSSVITRSIGPTQCLKGAKSRKMPPALAGTARRMTTSTQDTKRHKTPPLSKEATADWPKLTHGDA